MEEQELMPVLTLMAGAITFMLILVSHRIKTWMTRVFGTDPRPKVGLKMDVVAVILPWTIVIVTFPIWTMVMATVALWVCVASSIAADLVIYMVNDWADKRTRAREAEEREMLLMEKLK